MMNHCILPVVLCGLATSCLAADRLPTPQYHRQPSDPEWLAHVVQFHGHLGPAVVAGARLGMIGLRAVEAKGYFDVQVTCVGPFAKPPRSCFLDGVQVATGATTGKRTLNWVESEQIVLRVRNTRTGKTADLRPTPALMNLLGAFKSQPMAAAGRDAEERLEAIARTIAGMEQTEIVSVTAHAPGLRVPEEIERGMMSDSVQQKMKRQAGPERDPLAPLPELQTTPTGPKK